MSGFRPRRVVEVGTGTPVPDPAPATGQPPASTTRGNPSSTGVPYSSCFVTTAAAGLRRRRISSKSASAFEMAFRPAGSKWLHPRLRSVVLDAEEANALSIRVWNRPESRVAPTGCGCRSVGRATGRRNPRSGAAWLCCCSARTRYGPCTHRGQPGPLAHCLASVAAEGSQKGVRTRTPRRDSCERYGAMWCISNVDAWARRTGRC
jgi:hypothetical protein